MKTKPDKSTEQHFFELRIYKVYDYEKQLAVENYLNNALMPALQRLNIGPVGVFRRTDDVNDHSVFALIPYAKIEQFGNLNKHLAADAEFQKATAEYFQQEKSDPNFTRMESRLMKAFAGLPQLTLPSQSKEGKPRIFELRLYESHTEHHAALKVDMFNNGEIKLMQDLNMGPVFFGETVAGPDLPNMIYMLTADDMDANKKFWKEFIKHPEWARMSKLKKYKDTVSKIHKWFLKPTKFSQV